MNYPRNINNYLSFLVNSLYLFDQFRYIYLNILFEYFKINLVKYNDTKFIEINYSYPIINEIFDEMYSDIVLSQSIYSILFHNYIR